MLDASGKESVFVSEAACKIKTREPVMRIPKNKDTQESEYFSGVQATAREEFRPIAHGSRGGKSLGIKGIEGGLSNATSFVTNGLLWSWGPIAVRKWLQEDGWTIN